MNWKSRQGLWLAVAILLVAIVLSVLMLAIKPSPKSLSVPVKPLPVIVKRVVVGPHKPQIMLYGMIESTKLAKQKSKSRSTVSKVLVKEGQQVKQGQLLVKLGDTKRRLKLMQSEAELKQVQHEITVEKQQYSTDKLSLEHEKRMVSLADSDRLRMRGLAKKKYISMNELEDAEADHAKMLLNVAKREHSLNSHEFILAKLQAKLEVARAAVALAKEEVADTDFLAPYDGYVNNVYVSAGGRVEPGQPVVEVLSNDGYRVRATLPNSELIAVKQAIASGKTLKASMKWQKFTVPVTLRAISTNVDSGQISKDILFTMQQKNAHVALGQTVMVYLPLLAIQKAVELPLSALHGNDRIYKVVDGRLHSVKVQHLGDVFQTNGGHAVIVSSPQLKTGDVVLTSELPQAINGLAVSGQP